MRQQEAAHGNSSNNSGNSLVVNFLTPKQDPTPVLTREHFDPTRLLSWTERLPVELPVRLSFTKAVNVARFRLGLGEGVRFYFNCLPEHERISGLRAVPLVLTNSPEQEALRPGTQVYVFVSAAAASPSESPDSDQGGDEEADSRSDNWQDGGGSEG